MYDSTSNIKILKKRQKINKKKIRTMKAKLDCRIFVILPIHNTHPPTCYNIVCQNKESKWFLPEFN